MAMKHEHEGPTGQNRTLPRRRARDIWSRGLFAVFFGLMGAGPFLAAPPQLPAINQPAIPEHDMWAKRSSSNW